MPSLISSLSGAIELLALGAFAFEPQNLFVEESYSSKGTRCLHYGSATVAPPSTRLLRHPSFFAHPTFREILRKEFPSLCKGFENDHFS